MGSLVPTPRGYSLCHVGAATGRREGRVGTPHFLEASQLKCLGTPCPGGLGQAPPMDDGALCEGRISCFREEKDTRLVYQCGFELPSTAPQGRAQTQGRWAKGGAS